MSRSLLAVGALLLGSLIALVPTVAPDLAPATAPRLHLDIDLQGGTALDLVVDHHHTARTEVARDARYLSRRARDHGLESTHVQAWDTQLRIRSDLDPPRIAEFIDQSLGTYELVSSDHNEHRFALTEYWTEQLRQQSLAQAEKELTRRATCITPDGRVERWGDGLRITLPGEVDLNKPDCF